MSLPATFSPSPLSPAAFGGPSSAAKSLLPRRPSFPPSRALRPFAAISTAPKSSTPTPGGGNAMAKGRRTLKFIEAPAGCKMSFQLNLTQAEFSRQK
ncbi:hypothetical protein HWV62_40872 [Athelia sp. TMB]|nr:hypothetical protein HWV62_40872 [Athelia sp. TMB]